MIFASESIAEIMFPEEGLAHDEERSLWHRHVLDLAEQISLARYSCSAG